MHTETSAELRERSIPELLRELSSETATLIRQEMKLARVELVEKGKHAQAAAVSFSATAVLGLGAFLALTAAFVAALSLVTPVWLAALIVAVVYGIVAFVMAQSGKKQLKDVAPLVPEQTADTIKEDIAWAKTLNKSDAK